MKAEQAFKWGIAIVVIFGILNAFYFLDLAIGLKIAIPVLCVFLIGSILLQSGNGGGLAAIGGLGDQSAFGTRTSGFLTRVTYLIGAAFIVATVFMFKLSVPTRAVRPVVTHEAPAASHTHEHSAPEGMHDHGDASHAEGKAESAAAVGMQTIPEERPVKSGQENTHQPATTKGETPQGQPVGMNPVEEEK